MTDSRSARYGPVAPTPAARSVLSPVGLDQARLDPDGLLGRWQRRNAEATLPHCIQQLRESGALDNMRRVSGQYDGEFVGMWFADTDIYKTLEAVIWELSRRPAAQDRDDELYGFLNDTVSLLDKAQDSDGYLNSYFQVDHRDQQWHDLRSGHELYCAGHLVHAAVAAARVGVAEQLVVVARRFADLLVRRFGPDGIEAVCGHPEIETALVELYRVTGHRPYLELATRFVDLRGHGLLGGDRMGPAYYQDHRPIREAPEVTGHAVRQNYLLAGATDVATETGDATLLQATRRLSGSARRAKTYLTGAHGSRHRDEAFGDAYELPPDRAYGETCAAIASFHSNFRLLLATGERAYADEMERVLYNAIAGASAVDGTRFFYSNPLQLRTGHDGSHEDSPSRRLPWYSCACCPPNLARLMASLHTYVATVDSTGVQVHLYCAGAFDVTIDGQPVTLAVSGNYPLDGNVAVRVRAGGKARFTLSLRVPAWCEEYQVTVDGVAVEEQARDGYLRLTRAWVESTVVLALSMPARLVAAHPHVDAVRGCLALMRGPLVYCLEQADLPDGVAVEDVTIDPADPLRLAGPAAPDWPAGVMALAARGLAYATPSEPLYRDAGAGRETDNDADAPMPLELRAVPYFLWGNRAPGGMRVWIPAESSRGPFDVGAGP
jgi:DUF1680 family protein